MERHDKAFEADLRLAAIYQEFLPRKVFDAHMHMYLGEAIPAFRGPDGVFPLDQATPERYMDDMRHMLPGVESVRLNMMPMPDKILNDLDGGMRDKANGHVSAQALRCPEHVCSAYVLPGDSEETIGNMLRMTGMRGLKPYCYGAGAGCNGNTPIRAFIPEAAWVVAQETGVPIILHMMRSRSLSDPDNFAYIDRMTRRYPEAPLVLAHCARSFASWTGVKSIRHLNDRGNIWFDMSAVCEVGPIMAAILKYAGKRTMWGTDWPVCMHQGRAISMVDDQLWLMDDSGEKGYAHIAAEALFAFYQASILLELDPSQISDIFYGNAMRLFHV